MAGPVNKTGDDPNDDSSNDMEALRAYMLTHGASGMSPEEIDSTQDKAPPGGYLTPSPHPIPNNPATDFTNHSNLPPDYAEQVSKLANPALQQVSPEFARLAAKFRR